MGGEFIARDLQESSDWMRDHRAAGTRAQNDDYRIGTTNRAEGGEGGVKK